MIDFILIAVFLGSAGALLALLFQKAPLLHSIPEERLRQSFLARPSHFHKLIFFCKAHFHPSRYERAAMFFLEKTLRRMRVRVLKVDAALSRLILRIQDRSKIIAGDHENNYWQNLSDWRRQKEAEIIPEASFSSRGRGDRTGKILKIFGKRMAEKNSNVSE